MRTILTGIVILMLGVPSVYAQDESAYYTEPYQKKALEIYRASIPYRTALSYGQVPAFTNFLAAEFRNGGFPNDDVHILPFTREDGEQTAMLVIRYRGDGSAKQKPILLLGHMDVVDAFEQDWERDPFTLIEQDGYFFGRGAYDNKLGTTILTTAFLRLKADNFRPKRDLIIAFSGDEETGMETTSALFSTYSDLTDAEFALNGDAGGGVLNSNHEPTSFILQAAEKTHAKFELTVRNPGGHSSRPAIKNAIYELADALKKIEAHRFPVRWNETSRRYFELTANTTTGELSRAMQQFAENPDNEEATDILFAYPSQVGITRTTCVATMLRGGHAPNALPQSATATLSCRIFPGIAVADIKAELQRIVANDELEIEELGTAFSSPASPLRDDVVAAVTRAVHSLHPNVPVIPYMAPYATDGKFTRAAGIPTYGVMGLFIRSEDSFAHGLNERVPVRSFYGALEYWDVLLRELAGP
jgi:acetylornithine deacetylase/succinyl-diaminopimelate desuccinylase-like protein